MRMLANVVLALFVAALIVGCAPSASSPPPVTSPSAGPSTLLPFFPTPGSSVRRFPSPTIEIPPPID